MCVHTHTAVHAHVCELPSLPCPRLGGEGELAQHPLKGAALERFDMAFLHSTDCMQHSFKKKKIIRLFACSVTKIIFTSLTLTVCGQEAERLCRPHCFPAPRDARQITALPSQRRGSDPAAPGSRCELGLWLTAGKVTGMHGTPSARDTDGHNKNTAGVRNLGKEEYFPL